MEALLILLLVMMVVMLDPASQMMTW